MNVLIAIILLALLTLPVSAQTTLTGGIGYNVASAREELLQNKPQKLSAQLISKHLRDENFSENMNYLLKGHAELKDRTLAMFSDGTYAVMLHQDKFHVWYYSKSGNLIYAEEKDGLDYPYKSYKYNTNGRLINMGLRVSKGETFIYTPEGKLIAHWINSNGYDENGNIIMTRKYAE